MKDKPSARYLDSAGVEVMIRLLAEAADPTIEMTLRQRKLIILEGLGQLLDANAWVWIVGRMDTSVMSDALAVNVVDGGWINEKQQADYFQLILDPNSHQEVNAPFWKAISEVRSLTLSRDQIVSDEVYRVAPYGQRIREIGFEEFLLSTYPLNPAQFSSFGFVRKIGKPVFTDRERTIVHCVIQQIDWLHRAGSDAQVCETYVHLTPRERQVMLYLLAGESRKLIAKKLGLSQHTIVDYLKAIYRKFQVNNRAELVAKFVPGKSP